MRIKPIVILAFLCCSVYADDTTAALSGATRSTHFVTAVDHTQLVNGDTRVIANQNGTASISGVASPTYSFNLPCLSEGTTWSWEVVFSGYLAVGSPKTEINFDDMIASRGNLDGLTEMRVRITQLETGAVVAQEQTVTFAALGGGPFQFSSDMTLEQAFSYYSSSFTAGSAIFAIARNGSNYTLSCSFQGFSSPAAMSFTGGTFLKNVATVDQIPTLSPVATSGSYNDLMNKPTNVSSFSNDANYVPASTATNIAKQIIRSAVANVNVNLQSAEDARVALTNLITILKNL